MNGFFFFNVKNSRCSSIHKYLNKNNIRIHFFLCIKLFDMSIFDRAYRIEHYPHHD